MSYILDALKKSERDRKQEKKPVAGSVSVYDTVNEKQGIGSKFLMIIILANIILVAYVMLDQLGVLEKSGLIEEVNQTPEPETSQIQVVDLDEPEAKTTVLPRPEKADADSADLLGDAGATKDNSVRQKAIDQVVKNVLQQVNKTPEFSLDHENNDRKTPVAKTNVVKPVNKIPAKKSEESSFSLTHAEVKVKPVPTEETIVAQKEEPLPTLAQLPFHIKEQLSDLKLTVHIFSNKPSSRRVWLNGRSRREGEKLANQVSVEQITPKGVILSFRGERFVLLK
jgi:general secretion pathway protein B